MLIEIQFQTLDLSNLQEVYELETKSYPPDEAATYEKLKYRLENARQYFIGAFAHPNTGDSNNDNKKLVGFVCSTLSRSKHLHHESMANHEPDGETLCIHSVVVEPSERRQGLGTRMVLNYVDHMRRHHQHQVKRLALISKQHLVPFYENCGFKNLGLSEVVHGADPWYEMVL